MLEVKDIHVAYGQVKTLYGVSLSAQPSEILCLLGRNGAGKTTIMKSIMGLLPVSEGSVTLEGEDLTNMPAHLIPRRGIGYIPQGRRLFPELTVAENIEIGLMTRKQGPDTRDWVLDLFPRLRERLGQAAGTLSGGEQQMLATARALCLRPKVLLLDEPTEGLQPSMIEQIRQVIVRMKAEGFAIVLVEQRVDAVLSIADKVAFIENGRDVETTSAADLEQNPDKLTRYLGV
ncbi:ABC transporter ATP-binding protein [Sulfitobacter mediterraneus]|jgi:branched-chain amino acid transport system ATP-binding protein|uniref:Amino acid/amide ABC transporter ATP-binding protein 2 (HAAT family) n=1 Tax=Sulfitobacter mediterraneus TaxID=83219 RepID=A0A2T6CA40_9RHOB|nr:ABC transporter ATP-binding protein [Sulfitobacter mediterraneus]KIN77175.1 ABC transporter-like protein [Sulfitobacter mediterraneus KCTC 32188]MBM1558241.1 ABC transporter ATP-binding protein [Sulfitobacter mediterraneus]MBM1570187.1 ABC transporter ATP-binding protein [Sulfitobacter mediterraneus]MBM1573447.1 ABC transporter ATP-binding protein [Sulfitobacter mediterraneus]MBM1577371.1 ABC transporter ATP-binding protein [Sulfitobacter mediterraneus]